MNEKDRNLADDSDLSEKTNKYIIAEQSFYLVSSGQVIYRFPYVNVLKNDIYVKDDVKSLSEAVT